MCIRDRNDYHGFGYTSAEHMIEHCKACLNRNGLVVRATAAIVSMVEGVMMLRYTFVVTHAATATSITDLVELPIVPGKGARRTRPP